MQAQPRASAIALFVCVDRALASLNAECIVAVLMAVGLNCIRNKAPWEKCKHALSASTATVVVLPRLGSVGAVFLCAHCPFVSVRATAVKCAPAPRALQHLLCCSTWC